MAIGAAIYMTVLLLFYSECVKLLLDPSEIEIGNGNLSSVNVTCTLTLPVLSIRYIKIHRKSYSYLHDNFSAPVVLAYVYNTTGNASTSHEATTGMVATGSIYSRTISLIMSNLSCKDAGIYQCSSLITVNSTLLEPSQSQNLTVYIYPGNISVQGDNTDMVESRSLTINCTGQIGRPRPGVTVQWAWEYESAYSRNWNPYPWRDKISTGEPYKDPKNECQMLQTSLLTFMVSKEDANREYRCYVQYVMLDGRIKNFEQYAAYYPSHAHEAVEIPITIVIAIIFGVLASIAIVVLGFLACHFFQKKMKTKNALNVPMSPVKTLEPICLESAVNPPPTFTNVEQIPDTESDSDENKEQGKSLSHEL